MLHTKSYLVLEKNIFKGVLPYMNMVVILVMGPNPFAYFFYFPAHFHFDFLSRHINIEYKWSKDFGKSVFICLMFDGKTI